MMLAKSVRLIHEDSAHMIRSESSYKRSISRGLSVLDPQLMEFIHDLETDGRETSLKQDINLLRESSSIVVKVPNNLTAAPETYIEDPLMDMLTVNLSKQLSTKNQPKIQSEIVVTSIPPLSRGYEQAEEVLPDLSIDAVEDLSSYFSPRDKRKVEVIEYEIEEQMPPSAKNGILVQDQPEQPAKVKRRRARRGQSRVSRFCHVCTRSSHTVQVHPCGNFFNPGSCRKVVCEKCFKRFNWDWEEALAQGQNWKCSHCSGGCPPASQCNNYQRVNNERRIREMRGKT